MKSFWAQVPDTDPRKSDVANTFPAILGVPVEQIWARVIPLSFHGDGVGVSRGTTVDAFSWSGVLGEGIGTLDIKNLISGLLSRTKCEGTSREYWKVVIWALQALVAGRYPTTDWEGEDLDDPRAGKYLANGLCCTIWEIKADMDS